MDKIKFLFLNTLVAFSLIFLYIILHELGHAIVAVMYGANITTFSVLDAYVTYSGGHFTTIGSSFLNIAGVLFPYFVCVILSIFYNKNNHNLIYKSAFFTFYVCIIFSVFFWIIYPFLNNKDPNEDVTKFMEYSGFSPLMSSISAFIFVLFIVFLGWKKGVFQQMKKVQETLKNNQDN